ncbi:MAG: response regulator [bacterium]|nr:response regulator [bacterium]
MNKKILIIEDEPALLAILTDRLTKEEFVPLTAKDGAQGLEIALRDQPDLILLDIIMPVMDGMAMLKKLRESGEWGKTVPVIMLTNLSSDSNKVISEVTALQPAYYIVKTDMKLDEVMQKIQEVLTPPAPATE